MSRKMFERPGHKVPMSMPSFAVRIEEGLQRFACSLRWACGAAVVAMLLSACGGGNDQALSPEAQAQRDQTAAVVQAQHSVSQRIAALVQPGSGTEDFESGMADWQNWGNAQVVAGAGTSGSNALQVGTAAGGAGLSVPGVVAGTTYRLTANVRVSDLSDPGVLGVNFYNAAGEQLAAYSSPQSIGTTYASLTLDAVAPPNSASALVWVWKNAGSGYVYVDDVAFGPAAAPPPPPTDTNLVSNGGFEAGMTGWADWGNTHVVTGQANSGTSALSVGTAAGGAGQIVEGIVAGATYRLGVSAKVSDASETVFVGVNFLNQAGSGVGTTQLSTTSISYTALGTEIVAPPGAARALVYVWKNAGSGLGYVDDFAFGVASGSAPPLSPASDNLVVNGQLFGLSGWVNWGNAAGTGARGGGAQVGPDAGGFAQNISGIVAGQPYRLSALVNVSTAGETGYLGLAFVDSAGNTLQNQLAPFTSTAVSTAQVELVAPADAVGALVYVWKNAGSGLAVVQTVSFVQLGSIATPAEVQLSGSAPERLDADGLSTHRGQSIARLSNGNYVAAWVATSGQPGLSSTVYQVCFQRLDANLARLGANVCLADAQAADAPTAVLPRPDGGFVIVWHMDSSPYPPTVTASERSQAFDAAGNAVGAIQQGPQQPVPATAAALAGGGYVVVSAAAGNPVPPDASNLSFQRYSADGTPIGSPTSVGDKAGLPGAQVVPLAGGGFAVAWNEGPHSLTFTRMFTADGTPVGEPVLSGGDPLYCSNPSGCTFQDVLGLTPMDDGGYLVVWRNGYGVGGSTLGTFARRVKADGSPGAAVGTLTGRILLAVSPAGPDGFVLVWIDAAGHISMQRFDATPLR
jgi:hypothetical protein